MTSPKLSIVREPGMEPEQIDHEARYDLKMETAVQVEDARSLAALPASAFLRWPWEALDRQTGGMGPGTVSYVCAFSGSGKSTFITSAIDRWLAQGKRIYHMPLETNPEEWRNRWACHRIGLNSGDMLAGVAQLQADWPHWHAKLDAELKSQEREMGKFDNLLVSPVEAVTAAGFADAMDEAAEWRADVVIVDHIDHIGDEDKDADFNESMRVNKAALRLAKRYRLRVLATSQLNMEIAKADPLSKFTPPQVHHVYQRSAKLHGGAMMIGLYRPLRDRRPDEPAMPKGQEDKYVEAFRAARQGLAEPSTMWKLNTMGVVTMKLRNQGKDRHEGQRCELGVEHGRVIDLNERDAYKTTW